MIAIVTVRCKKKVQFKTILQARWKGAAIGTATVIYIARSTAIVTAITIGKAIWTAIGKGPSQSHLSSHITGTVNGCSHMHSPSTAVSPAICVEMKSQGLILGIISVKILANLAKN
jgi:hypothetical protein